MATPKTKPVVRIKEAEIIDWPFPKGPKSGLKVLCGYPIDYPYWHIPESQRDPNRFDGSTTIWTSAIISVTGNLVETARTIYKVESWKKG